MTARHYQAEPQRRPNYVVDGYLVIGEPTPRRWFQRPWVHVGLVLALIVVLFAIVTSTGGTVEVFNP